MRASLDTNVIIHLYKAGLQSVLFDVFDEGVFIYEQIRDVELENHGRDVLELVDVDISSGKIVIYNDQKLKDQAVYKIFENIFYHHQDEEFYHLCLFSRSVVYYLI